MAGITYPLGDSSARMDAFLSSTLEAYYNQGKFENAAHDASPLFAWLKGAGRIETVDGGHDYTVNVRYGGNETVGPVNEAEELDLSLQDGMTRVHYNYAEYAGAVSITNKEKAANKGKGKLVDLAAEKVQQTLDTHVEKMEKDLFDVANMTEGSGLAGTSATGAPQILPLPLIVYDDPLSTSNVVAGLDSTTYTWWANQYVDYGATNTHAAFSRKFAEAYQKPSIYGPPGQPDLCLVDPTTWLNYVVVLDAGKQFRTSDERMASLGFENLKYMKAVVTPSVFACDPESQENYDNPPTAGVAYFLNSKYLKLIQKKGRTFKPGPFRPAPKQLMSTAIFESELQLITTNRQKNCVLFGITKTAPTAS